MWVIAVVQFNPYALSSNVFCKGTRSNNNYAGWCLNLAPNAGGLTWYLGGGGTNAGAITYASPLSTNQIYVIAIGSQWLNPGWKAVASINGRSAGWTVGGSLPAAPGGSAGGAPPTTFSNIMSSPGTGVTGPWTR